jgi:hypothetical protein
VRVALARALRGRPACMRTSHHRNRAAPRVNPSLALLLPRAHTHTHTHTHPLSLSVCVCVFVPLPLSHAYKEMAMRLRRDTAAVLTPSPRARSSCAEHHWHPRSPERPVTPHSAPATRTGSAPCHCVGTPPAPRSADSTRWQQPSGLWIVRGTINDRLPCPSSQPPGADADASKRPQTGKTALAVTCPPVAVEN